MYFGIDGLSGDREPEFVPKLLLQWKQHRDIDEKYGARERENTELHPEPTRLRRSKKNVNDHWQVKQHHSMIIFFQRYLSPRYIA